MTLSAVKMVHVKKKAWLLRIYQKWTKQIYFLRINYRLPV